MAQMLKRKDCCKFIKIERTSREVRQYLILSKQYQYEGQKAGVRFVSENKMFLDYKEYGPLEIAQWLKENNIKYYHRLSWPDGDIIHEYGFKTEEDAFTFTMRWV